MKDDLMDTVLMLQGTIANEKAETDERETALRLMGTLLGDLTIPLRVRAGLVRPPDEA